MTVTLNAIGIVAGSIPESLDFYRLLGIDVADPEGDQPHAEANVGSFRLMWDSAASIKAIYPEWTPPRGGQPMTLAFECGTPAGVDDIHGKIVAAGYQSFRDPWDAPWGQRYAVVTDPDGNQVDLYASLSAQA